MAEQWQEGFQDTDYNLTLDELEKAVNAFLDLNYDEERADVMDAASALLFENGEDELGGVADRAAGQYRSLAYDVAGEFEPDSDLKENTESILNRFRTAATGDSDNPE